MTWKAAGVEVWFRSHSFPVFCSIDTLLSGLYFDVFPGFAKELRAREYALRFAVFVFICVVSHMFLLSCSVLSGTESSSKLEGGEANSIADDYFSVGELHIFEDTTQLRKTPFANALIAMAPGLSLTNGHALTLGGDSPRFTVPAYALYREAEGDKRRRWIFPYNSVRRVATVFGDTNIEISEGWVAPKNTVEGFVPAPYIDVAAASATAVQDYIDTEDYFIESLFGAEAADLPAYPQILRELEKNPFYIDMRENWLNTQWIETMYDVGLLLHPISPCVPPIDFFPLILPDDALKERSLVLVSEGGSKSTDNNDGHERRLSYVNFLGREEVSSGAFSLFGRTGLLNVAIFETQGEGELVCAGDSSSAIIDEESGTLIAMVAKPAEVSVTDPSVDKICTKRFFAVDLRRGLLRSAIEELRQRVCRLVLADDWPGLGARDCDNRACRPGVPEDYNPDSWCRSLLQRSVPST